MDLRRLTQNTGCRLLRGDALTEITSVCCDSRCAGPGALFVCLPGRHADGHDFAAQAVAAGAAAVLCTHDVPGLPAGWGKNGQSRVCINVRSCESKYQ